MTEIRFYDSAEDSLLKFAVIIARADGKWVFCRHRDRDTLEVPGGHREGGETILDTAKRELTEETGAAAFALNPVCIYSVTAPDDSGGAETFGMLYCAEIRAFGKGLHHEIAEIVLTEELAEHWTYPLIQPKLIAEALRRGCLDIPPAAS